MKNLCKLNTISFSSTPFDNINYKNLKRENQLILIARIELLI